MENRNLAKILAIVETIVPYPCAKVCDVMTHNSQWSIPSIKQLINDHLIIQNTQGIPLAIHDPTNSLCYSLCWGWNSSGTLSTKSIVWATHDLHDHNQSSWPFR